MSFDFFYDPPVTYRLAPFWFWNDDMDAQEVVRQIREMAEKGVGGIFICARQGLKIPYLSEQWFRLVAVAVEAAQQYGLRVWLYDEYPYPSGMSGGEVTLQHPDARHRQLFHRSFTIDGPQPLSYELPWAKVLIARAVPLAESTGALLWSRAVDLAPSVGSVPAQTVFQSTGLTAYTNKRFFTASPQKRLIWDVPPGRWRVILFLEQEIENFKYYGTYVDPCHREAVRTFLETTHEQYARHFHEQFGQAIKGIFTDEVGMLGRVPWSARLPDFVRERYGEEIIDRLPALFDPQDKNSAQIRYQFFQSLHQLLNESYHQQVSEWCEQHQLQYTTEVPSMRMTTQLYSHMPGGDSAHEKVGRSLEWILDCNAYSLRADPKIVSSLAHQLGAERAMIECFHSVGWSMTLQDAKWMLDRLAALGINFFVLHAFFYSISGLRKHDAPPSQFFQNPYWEHFRQLTDYAGRLCYALSQGEVCHTVAVVHPVTSFWTHMGNPFQQFRYCGNDATEERALELLKQDWAYLCKQLLLHQIGYDHLDPEMLARATILDGRLVIGRARYEMLILPPMTNLEMAAWSQVKAFLQAGGKVISVGLLPYEDIEGQQNGEAEILQWFGLTTSPRQSYWRRLVEEQAGDEVKNEQAKGVPWTKGSHAAYFLTGAPGANSIEHLLMLLQQYTPPTILLEPVVGDRTSFLMHQRNLPDGSQVIFITHQEGTEKKLRLYLAQPPAGQAVERLDIASGERTLIPV
ncbi:MAG TPA: glycosyl hydrolase, partial [Ktedonobacteraceae bacterium]